MHESRHNGNHADYCSNVVASHSPTRASHEPVTKHSSGGPDDQPRLSRTVNEVGHQRMLPSVRLLEVALLGASTA